MSDMIIPKDSTTIAYSDNPALVYLKSLGATSTRTMQQALETIAWLLSSGQASIDTFPWGSLRIKHTRGKDSIRSEVGQLLFPR